MVTYPTDTETRKDTELDQAVTALRRVMSTERDWDTVTRRPFQDMSAPKVTPKGKTLYIVQRGTK